MVVAHCVAVQQVDEHSVVFQEGGVDARVWQTVDRLSRVVDSEHLVHVDLADVLLKIED